MRLISTRTLKPGMILATTVYNGQGQALIQEKVSITERMIRRLKELEVQYVYIEDRLSSGIKVKEAVPYAVRQEAVNTIEETFRKINNHQLSINAVALEKSADEFKVIIDTVLKEIKLNDELITILTDVFTYDSYIVHHSFNVTIYTLAIGMELKLPPKQLEMLGLGAILHDIGKMLVPEDILMKPDKLTIDEFSEVKKHSQHGFNILRQLHSVSLIVAHCAFQHHERLDGSGYPRGIKGEDIHPFAKIIAVADVFDAMTSNRVYRRAMLPHEALEVLYAGAGTLFDKNVVEAFRHSVAIYPNGLVVILSDGRKGIVSKQNKGLADRPVLRIIEENQIELLTPYELDLKTNLDLVIHDFDAEYESNLTNVN
ncbi:putative nucleotidyltransferase with HDIG domain [Bacillus pakistanensis]|uniref:Nucleotidyltransferase with HDIG domain n=1 Tax=Rossellomorea pakistanensis TaxID=992288 RepID=A0ABS2NEB7_9BACI|nr:HD-GYP domain-containing protein [Bacillus pakistanensis]MBM7586200.1 putative nucleotidyltransferase with HDIG domain [Bacillus pakistanensis]